MHPLATHGDATSPTKVQVDYPCMNASKTACTNTGNKAMSIDLSKFQVDPKSKLHLKDWKTNDDEGLAREVMAPIFQENLKAISELQYKLFADSSHGLLIVIQGIDTAGKDGVIRDVFSCMNPQGVYVKSFKKPEKTELAHDYLWRVHQACPGKGMIGVFNRSHYEDVLITRVHKWIDAKTCQRRYEDINNFEKLLTNEGTTIVKLFLLISKDEQFERLQSRIDEPQRNWKFNLADLAERKFWNEYMDAFHDALAATSEKHAPWFVIPSDKKWFRNLLVSEILLKTLQSLDLKWPKPEADAAVLRKALNDTK